MDQVRGPDDHIIGHLEDDGKTVTDGEGKVVGVMDDYGSVVPVPADSSILPSPLPSPLPAPTCSTMDEPRELASNSSLGGPFNNEVIVGQMSSLARSDEARLQMARRDVQQAPNGQSLGTLQPDGKTVVDSEGKVVGVRNADGSVLTTPLSGVPMASVVASQSTVAGTSVNDAENGTIGQLQDDGLVTGCKLVVREDGNVLGIRNSDGSIVGGSLAGVPATAVRACSSTVATVPRADAPDCMEQKVAAKSCHFIGTLQPDGSTVINADGNVVGYRYADGGAVVTRGPLLSAQSTVAGSTVSDADGNAIGELQDESLLTGGKLVVGDNGNVVGVRNGDGSIVGGSIVGRPAGDVLAGSSSLSVRFKVTGADGTTIGTAKPDGATIVDGEGNIVGKRVAEGGYIVMSGMSGVPAAHVVASSSTLAADGAVEGDKCYRIGQLLDDGKTVADDAGNVVGVRHEDGSIVSTCPIYGGGIGTGGPIDASKCVDHPNDSM